jgi:hypothetical protein
MRRFSGALAFVAIALVSWQSSAWGAIGATATYTSQLVGSTYQYNLTLTNTSTNSEPIGTFWFAWVPANVIGPIPYDFLTHTPTVSAPSGWIGIPVTDGVSAGGGSIEWYDTGTALAAGQSLSGFNFTSSDPPSTIGGTAFGFPVATSWVYMGAFQNGGNPSDQGSQVTAQSVPEPSILLLPLAGVSLLRRRAR